MEGWSNQKLKEFIEKIPELDAENAIEAVGGSEELYDKILKQIISRIPDNIQTMDKNLAAGGDLRYFTIMVHGLKSSLRQIGHQRLASLSDMLETHARDDDLSFCQEWYTSLRNELLFFCEQAEALMCDGVDKSIETGTEINDIAVYKNELERAKVAAEEYDTLAATEIITQLLGCRFDKQTDAELSLVLSALESFQPLSALVHIEKLIAICGNTPPQPVSVDEMCKILVVDDNPANLTLVKGILSEHGFKVYPVSSGQTALNFLKKQRPDLILLDMEMPDMNGEEVFRAIVADPEHDQIPIIFLTGNNDPESEVNAFRIGAADYMRKPISDVILLARVRMQLDLATYRSKVLKK